ncbi:actin cortical patch SUR7/pH-response regulator pali [Xylogone sp. PMI_703]|nr:actin cortical patch SUR7/pH-response regulator pali [Xylogone sp. PMI_703]
MRFTALLPFACAVVAFILSMLCLFAGHKRGFMEDYHILTVNTSTLGHNLFNDTASSSSGIFGSLFSNITNTIENDLDGALDDLADKLSKELGIEQWYSLHLMDLCEGTYAPNATANRAKKNVTSCTNETAMYHFDLEKTLNEQLSVGDLHINLSDIGWPDTIQDDVNKVNVALDATFVLYVIGIAAAGLLILTSFVSVFLNGSRLVSFGNWGLAVISFLTLLAASIIVTVFQDKAASAINKYGNDIGAYAYKGKKYLIITWVSVAVMFLAVLAWMVEFCVGRRNSRREYTEKRIKGPRSRKWGPTPRRALT